jgi:hypothetical protein
LCRSWMKCYVDINKVHLIYGIFYMLDFFIFCLDDLSIDDSGVLKSPTTTVLELIYAFRSFRVCLMKFGALTLGA